MFRILKIKDLEERKRALVQESDVYRETLKLQFDNLLLYASRTQRKFSLLGRLNPLLMLLAPFAGKLSGMGAFPKMRLLSMSLFAWKMFKRIRSVSSFFFRRKKPEERNAVAEEESAGAR